MSELRSALVVAVPEAASTVDPWRERTCADRPSVGIPPHVTVLFPFVPASALDHALEDELGELFARFEPFSFELRRARRFPGVLYLAPEPAEAFLELIRTVAARYQGYPPYAGKIALESIVPHLTVAHGDDALLDSAEAEVRPELPISAFAREVLVLEECEPDGGRWETRAAIPLGLGSAP